ncbi:MAG: DAK2 domain-containing protein [Actinomycetales bacterium]|nr:DAK2 domain-containing protein [Actinomycetales bacterium]
MERFDGATATRWARLAAERLDEQHAWINSINVFPVADSDTGTNSLLTVSGGLEAVAELAPGQGVAEVLAAFARGALVSARGNSGVIISQFVGGMAAHLALLDEADVGATQLSRALKAGHRAARESVAVPVRGTVLSATKRSAKHARRAAKSGGEIADVCQAALDAAREATRRSPEQLPVLAEAGVVDAGASVLVVVLEALVEAVTGTRPPRSGALAGGLVSPERATIAAADFACAPDAGSDGEFELMFLLEADGREAGGFETGGDVSLALRGRLAELGESVAVVGAAGLWQAHVHTDLPAKALAAAALGAQRQVVVRHLGLHTGEAVPGGLGVVAAVEDPGLVAQVARTGAVVHVPSYPAATPAELARAVTDTGAGRAVVVAADAGTLVAAHALAATDPRVTVLEVRDGLHAALALGELVAGSFATPDESEQGLRAAAAGVRTRRLGADDGALGGLVGTGTELVAVLHGSRVPPAVIARLEADALAAGAGEFLALDSWHDDDAVLVGALAAEGE